MKFCITNRSEISAIVLVYDLSLDIPSGNSYDYKYGTCTCVDFFNALHSLILILLKIFETIQ